MSNERKSTKSQFPLYREAYEKCLELEGWDSMSEEQQVVTLGKAIEELNTRVDSRRIPQPPKDPDIYRVFMRHVLRDFKEGSE